MRLKLYRYASNEDSTGGLLFINDEFCCFTCEDEYRSEKVYGETRIPYGVYEIKLRDAGGMNAKYAERYPFHRGMLHLQDVPGFEWIYIHTGNTEDQTEGCILVGLGAYHEDGENKVSNSRMAYEKLYNYILLATENGEEIIIEVKDGLV